MGATQQAFFGLILVAMFFPECQAQRCCYPNQLEGNITIYIPGTTGKQLVNQITFGMSFDWTEQGTRYDFPVTGLTHLSFYKQGVYYSIYNSTCVTGKLEPLPISTICVPDDAKVTQKYQLGLKSMINLTDYTFLEKGNGTASWVRQTVRTVTDMCGPVEDKYFDNNSESKDVMLTTVTFEKITPGIKDPGIFDVPSVCKSSAVKMQIRPENGNHFPWNVIGGMHKNF